MIFSVCLLMGYFYYYEFMIVIIQYRVERRRSTRYCSKYCRIIGKSKIPSYDLIIKKIKLYVIIESTSIFFGRKNGVRFLDTRARPQVIIGMFF